MMQASAAVGAYSSNVAMQAAANGHAAIVWKTMATGVRA